MQSTTTSASHACLCIENNRLPCARANEVALGLVALRRELHSHALRLTRCQAQAEDLVQDTVERALKFEGSFERGTNLRAWVHQILSNLFVSRCRRLHRESKALEILSSDPCAWTHNHMPTPVCNELSPSTRRAIDALPPRFRSTVVLIDVQELSYRAAAEQLGVPVGTVMSRLHRGRRLLADTLRQEPMRQAA